MFSFRFKPLPLLLVGSLLSVSAHGQTKGCYLSVRDFASQNERAVQGLALSLFTRFVEPVRPAPVGAGSDEDCRYVLSLSETKKGMTLSITGPGGSGSGKSSLEGPPALREAMLRAIQSLRPESREEICRALPESCKAQDEPEPEPEPGSALSQGEPGPRPEQLQASLKELNRQIERLRPQEKNQAQKLAMLDLMQRRGVYVDQLKGLLEASKGRQRLDFDESLAFLSVETTPQGLDVYLDDEWIGQTPVEFHRVEANREYRITVTADPRYYAPLEWRRSLGPLERSLEKRSLERLKGKLHLTDSSPIKQVFVNGCEVALDSTGSVALYGGNNLIQVRDEKGFARLEAEVWAGEEVSLEVSPEHYVKDASPRFQSFLSWDRYDASCYGPLDKPTKHPEDRKGGWPNLLKATDNLFARVMDRDRTEGKWILEPFGYSGSPIFYLKPGYFGEGGGQQLLGLSGNGLGMRLNHSSHFALSAAYSQVRLRQRHDANKDDQPVGYTPLKASASESMVFLEYHWWQERFGQSGQWRWWFGLGWHRLQGRASYQTPGNETDEIRFHASGSSGVMGFDYVFLSRFTIGMMMRQTILENPRIESNNPIFEDNRSSSGNLITFLGYQM